MLAMETKSPCIILSSLYLIKIILLLYFNLPSPYSVLNTFFILVLESSILVLKLSLLTSPYSVLCTYYFFLSLCTLYSILISHYSFQSINPATSKCSVELYVSSSNFSPSKLTTYKPRLWCL